MTTPGEPDYTVYGLAAGNSTGSYKLVVNQDKQCAGVPRYYTGADGVLSGTESEGSTIVVTLGETINLDNNLVYKAAADVIDNTALPTVTGTPKVDEKLTAEDGSWTPSGVAYGYQWLADGAVISGATAKTYVPVAAVMGKKLSVKVTGSKTGSKTGYTSLSTTTGETAAVVAADVTPPGPLTTPKHLRSTEQGASTMTLAWDAVAGAGRYRIQISKSSSMTSPKYVSFDTNTGAVTGLASNTKFYFRVSVVNAADTARLTSYTAKTYPSAKTKAYDLSAPGHLKSTAQSSTTLTLGWDSVATAPRYRIQYSTSSTMSSPKYVSFAGNSGDLTGLKPNTTYYFRVAVANADDSARLSQYSVSPGPSAKTKVATP